MRDIDKPNQKFTDELFDLTRQNNELKENEADLNHTINTLLKSSERYQLLYESPPWNIN